jgi:folate-dependent phosphoribosylglycinamide formyltransferase PurN
MILPMGRLVVIAAENMASCRIVRPLLDQFADEIELVLLVPNMPIDNIGRRKRAWRLICTSSLQFVFLKFTEIYLHHIVARILGRTIWQHARRKGIKVRKYRSPSEESFVSDLKKSRPVFTLSAGPAILSREVINVASCATLNCHGGRLPEYRGAANYFWMLLAKEPYAYSTIQQMNYELDTGPVLAEQSFAIDPRWSAYRLNYELSGLGGELYARAVKSFLAGSSLKPLVRESSKSGNRGIPKRDDMSQFAKEGHSLCKIREVVTLI